MRERLRDAALSPFTIHVHATWTAWRSVGSHQRTLFGLDFVHHHIQKKRCQATHSVLDSLGKNEVIQPIPEKMRLEIVVWDAKQTR